MNQLVLPEYGIHSFVFFFFVLSMQLFAIAWNLPLFAYHIHRYIKRPIMRGPGIYDPTTIMNHDQLSKINREGWAKIHQKANNILEQLNIYSSQLLFIHSHFNNFPSNKFDYYQFIEDDIFIIKNHTNRLKNLLDSFILQFNEVLPFLNQTIDPLLFCNLSKQLEPELGFSFEISDTKAHPSWFISTSSFKPNLFILRRPNNFFKINFQQNNAYFSSSPKQSSWLQRFLSKFESDSTAIYYISGIAIIMLGLSFAFIPFFRILCETTSFNGVAQIARNLNKIATMEKVDDCLIRVQFNADVPSSMQWKFKPLQDEIYVSPGETALAFFTAYNPTNKPIVGISTYNLSPFQAAYYFNKIQCFCFDEQILNPGEEVDLPVFFYIDPDFVNDPLLEDVTNLLLSYTFFESGANLKLPSPFDPNNRPLNKSLQKFEEKEKKKGSLLESVNAIA
uniref:Cytochrome c oxidase assembly protein COX11, mitochondrial n=1 Tax=Meloidogyne floridensis TaxID=298350 RepID=A0A915P7B6_9BILA